LHDTRVYITTIISRNLLLYIHHALEWDILASAGATKMLSLHCNIPFYRCHEPHIAVSILEGQTDIIFYSIPQKVRQII